jgi:integrating conjugative element protein (TIGR03756 family)
MIKKACLLIAFMLMANDSKAQSLNTFAIEVASLAAAPACTGYCITGVCIWLRCLGPVCTVETTLQISHRSPDLVVSSYKNVGENVWAEANIISTAIGSAVPFISGGNSDVDSIESSSGYERSATSSLVFSEIDIFGGIGSDMFAVDSFGMLTVCDDDTTFLRPYYLSTLNQYAWRSGDTELLNPLTYLPIDVGLWGPLRPRMGFIHQAEEPKACAVLAQRALNITTRSAQLHIYNNAGGNESNWFTDQWQMLYPRPSVTCGPFGFNTEYSTGIGGFKGRYLWQVWRRKFCCVRNPGAILIAQARFPVLPPNCLF